MAAKYHVIRLEEPGLSTNGPVLVRFQVLTAASMKLALMMEAARTSETSVDIQLRTRQYIPKDSELYTRRRKNVKSHTTRNMLHSWDV